MTWTPQFKVLNARAIPDNLLAYIATNQADALLWANGTALRPIQQFSNSVANRAVPVYPAISFANDSDAEDYTQDFLPGVYSVVFEVMIQNSDPNTAVSEARSYAKAIKSMIRNCPNSTLTANTGANANSAVLESIETEFAEIKTNEMQNDFMQSFQLRAIFTLTAEAF